jgi:hypothetical protein
MLSWAKAFPSGTSDPAEIREFLEAGLVPVDCRGCAHRVLVRKASALHTSVQWTADPARHCPQFAERIGAGELSARIDGCPTLRASIDLAVSEGRIEVPDG